MAQEAPAVFDLPDEELERRRQALSYAVIWGKGGVSPELEQIERELDRRARLRAEEFRAEAQAARDEAWRKMMEREQERQGQEEALRAAQEEADRQAEEHRRDEQERLRAENEQRRLQEEERERAEHERRRREDETRRLEDERRRHREDELRRLAAEQVQTARLLEYGTNRIVELAEDYVRREDDMHELAGEEAEGFDQAKKLVGSFLRARLSAIPSLRLKADTSPHHNGGGRQNGRRASLEGQTRKALADLMPPPEDG